MLEEIDNLKTSQKQLESLDAKFNELREKVDNSSQTLEKNSNLTTIMF
jgi:hypothetical protein